MTQRDLNKSLNDDYQLKTDKTDIIKNEFQKSWYFELNGEFITKLQKAFYKTPKSTQTKRFSI